MQGPDSTVKQGETKPNYTENTVLASRTRTEVLACDMAWCMYMSVQVEGSRGGCSVGPQKRGFCPSQVSKSSPSGGRRLIQFGIAK